jgi:hypothetical protein
MIPSAFVQKWAASRGAERPTAQEHFIDLCRLLKKPCSVNGSTGSPRAEMRRHPKPLALSVSKGKQGAFSAATFVIRNRGWDRTCGPGPSLGHHAPSTLSVRSPSGDGVGQRHRGLRQESPPEPPSWSCQRDQHLHPSPPDRGVLRGFLEDRGRQSELPHSEPLVIDRCRS